MKSVCDEQLRAYFLGKLPASEAEDLEIECAARAELTDEAQMVERELADDYLRGELSAADARLFETNYLITEARRQRLAIAEGLRRLAGEQKATDALAATASPNSFWQMLFGKRHRLQLVFSGLFVLLAGGAVFLYFFNLIVDKNDVAEVKDVNYPPKIKTSTVKDLDENTQNLKTGSANSAVPNNAANKNSTLPPKTPSAVKPVSTPQSVWQNPSGLAVFVLLPGALRDEGEQFITLAPSVIKVRLQLNLREEAGKHKIYHAVLKTADGDEVFTSPNSKSRSLTISAGKLENRTYIIWLEGQNAQGKFESVTEYTFRVRR